VLRTTDGRGSLQAGFLKNDLYAGLIDGSPGEHEAIIDPETWEKATALRTAKARTNGPGRPPAGQHLFRGGMLRCHCGGAMVPRTDRNRKDGPYEAYRCYERSRDPESCSMPPIDRALIDTAVYTYFESVGLDLEATKQTLSDARDRKLAEVRALHEEAEREAQRADERLTRVRGHYQEGKIEPDDWAEQRPQLTTERDAAHAEAKRLQEAQAEAEADPDLSDVEADVLRKLTEIRKAIAGEVKDAEGVEAVRAALSRLFERLILHPTCSNWGRRGEHPSMRVGSHEENYSIELVIRTAAIAGYEGVNPVLRREPLNQAENNYAVGFAIR
jgi:Recombinase zinc beta ribbon domain